MGKLVVDGAMLMCSFGAAPGKLTVLPTNMVKAENKPVATMMDFKPTVNIAPFGMCMSPANPQVAAATAAAMGVLTPQPCVPATAQPWISPVPSVKVGHMSVLDENCQLKCMWNGMITITMPGTMQTQVP